MASSDAVVSHTTFDVLQIGRSSQFVVGRLLRSWDSKNIKKQGEFMGITLLLLDEKDALIHGFIPAAQASFYRPSLLDGSVVKVSRFEVSRSPTTYKITEHPFVIRFLPQTTIDQVLENTHVINEQKFMLRQYDHLQALANTNIELPDVVGQIQLGQGSDLENEGVMTRVVLRFMIAPSVVVYLSSWDEAAGKFRGIIASGDKTKAVMVVTTVNPKLFGGREFVFNISAIPYHLITNQSSFSVSGISESNKETISTSQGPPNAVKSGESSSGTHYNNYTPAVAKDDGEPTRE
ncbi:unnamed protein product [Eruca vesicaria subsp. sativa]|uniref:Replication protein A 70 kDa DNA-binding subunit B/D first OB fold domain-containing protein n=1 Tax=Eruca vesicaria subsp. sativa TaxID=29727 RepID=A0ABC8KG99_ERUVS|nr:unnamed protein product [Eruca vesicaria subsp. sativa]